MNARPAADVPFGHAALALFPLEPGCIYLNHGTVGVTPNAVMQARAAILAEIERHPSRFMLRELAHLRFGAASEPERPPRLRAAAESVGAFLGCRGDRLAFVDNATAACNSVMRSIDWRAGDEVLVSDHGYGGVTRAATFFASERGAVVRTLAWPFPASGEDAFVDAVAAAIGPRTRLAVLDHVTSETALVLPIAAMAAACRARGVPVLVDGAHAPGAIDLDIGSLGADWYAANLHKWAFAPRACGVLWAAPCREQGLHPAVISWGIDHDDWLQEFDWQGTRDPSPWLAAPAGIEFIEQTLGEAAMRAHNHRLACWAAQHLGERWRREWRTPEAMIGCMVTVPLPARFDGRNASEAQRLRDALLAEHHVEVPVIARGGRLWARLSLQVYNDESDVQRFADAVDAIAR